MNILGQFVIEVKDLSYMNQTQTIQISIPPISQKNLSFFIQILCSPASLRVTVELIIQLHLLLQNCFSVLLSHVKSLPWQKLF